MDGMYRIENGMLVGEREHDIQQHEPEGLRCSVCGGVYPPEWMSILDGKYICEECELAYFHSHLDEYREDFIAEHEQEFYWEFWWDDLPNEEKLDYIEKIYQIMKVGEKFPELERDFCLDHSDWRDFMRKELE